MCQYMWGSGLLRTPTSSEFSPKFLEVKKFEGGQIFWILGERMFLFGIPPLKAQND